MNVSNVYLFFMLYTWRFFLPYLTLCACSFVRRQIFWNFVSIFDHVFQSHDINLNDFHHEIFAGWGLLRVTVWHAVHAVQEKHCGLLGGKASSVAHRLVILYFMVLYRAMCMLNILSYRSLTNWNPHVCTVGDSGDNCGLDSVCNTDSNWRHSKRSKSLELPRTDWR